MWRKLAERVVFRSYRSVVARTFETPGGRAEFEVWLEGSTVVTVALTPGREVVLVQEFRPGPEQKLLELPGGMVDEGEEPLEAARRELLEETGYAGQLRPAGTYFANAYSTRIGHVFVATNVHRVQEPEEPNKVVLLPLASFREHLRSGRLTDVGPGYLGLDELSLL